MDKMEKSLFDTSNNLGYSMDEKERDELKRMGEKFYENIDMEKYSPKEVLSYPEIDRDQEKLIRYKQLQYAIRSGLIYEDLSDEEKELIKEIENN